MAPAPGPSGLCLDLPDGREELQHVRVLDIGDRSVANARERIAFENPSSVLRGQPATRRLSCFCSTTRRDVGEGGDTLPPVLGFAC